MPRSTPRQTRKRLIIIVHRRNAGNTAFDRIQNATVAYDGREHWDQTNVNGKVQLKLPPGTYAISASKTYSGEMYTTERTVEVPPRGRAVRLNIVLPS